MALLSFLNSYTQRNPHSQDMVFRYADPKRPLARLAPQEFPLNADRHSRNDIWNQK
jgi:hypothetical protein